MQGSLRQVTWLMTRRSRSGQAIIIIAFAFIALIAFVGIATDVALLFVRYSTLRRAVDAAAIAAAGQVREGTNYLTLNGVAMQFIQIHGLNPKTVKVETCETEVVKYLGGTGPYNQGQVQTALDALYPTSELCKRNPQKLVRVTAQVESPTAFLGIIGWRNVTLETSAISQTAALDVAIVLDTSYSQALDTRDREAEPLLRDETVINVEEKLKAFKDFINPGATYNGGAPPTLPSAPQKWGLGLSPSTGSTGDGVGNLNIRHECWYNPGDSSAQKRANYGWAGCCNDPTTQSDAPGSVVNAAIVGTNPYKPAGMTNFNTDTDWYVTDRSDLAESTINTNGTNPLTGVANSTAVVVSGSKDGNRSDLICQPFKQVRDAARRFIKALDFVRGDRVVLVTFDSNAKAIKPWKTDGTEGIEIFTEKSTAIRALNMQVGVEPNENSMQIGCHSLGNINDPIVNPNPPTDPKYYPDVNPKGIISYWTQSQCPATNTGGGILAASNALVNPDWVRREAVWVMVILSDGYPNRTPAQGTGGVYSADRDWLRVLPGTPGVDMPANNATDNAFLWQYCSKTKRDLSTGAEIDLVCNPDNPSCPPSGPDGYPDPNDDPNFGKLHPQMCASTQYLGLGIGPKPWGLPSPSSNAGSGSFGFCPWWTFCQLNPGDYTRLTQCTEAAPRGVWQDPANAAQRDPGDLPTCADPDPDSRHFCMDGSGKINPAAADNPNPAGYLCDPHYDADDYARDRVDFAALINYIDKPPTNLNNGKPLRGNFIAMYSIYFQHVAPGASTDVKENILGVKFLRYVADAGDNGKIDNRLQRWYRDERDKHFRTSSLPPTGRNEGTAPGGGTSDQPYLVGGGRGVTTKGVSGQPIPDTYDSADPFFDLPGYPATTEDPCTELDFRVTGNLPAPDATAGTYETHAKTDCGQFFFADSPAKVEKAFIEIASRLFTRLSR